jgi:hypothetical protein
MTLEQLAALSALGKAALAIFCIAGIGAAISFVPLRKHMPRLRELGFSVWRDADLRPKFLRFMGFCAAGVTAAIVGFMLGGWPTR